MMSLASTSEQGGSLVNYWSEAAAATLFAIINISHII
jgi:hypothetical protein